MLSLHHAILNLQVLRLLVKQDSVAIGQKLEQIGFQEKLGASVIALIRGGRQLKGRQNLYTIKALDILILQAAPNSILISLQELQQSRHSNISTEGNTHQIEETLHACTPKTKFD